MDIQSIEALIGWLKRFVGVGWCGCISEQKTCVGVANMFSSIGGVVLVLETKRFNKICLHQTMLTATAGPQSLNEADPYTNPRRIEPP